MVLSPLNMPFLSPRTFWFTWMPSIVLVRTVFTHLVENKWLGFYGVEIRSEMQSCLG